MNHGVHHISQRRRIYKNLEPLPHPVRWKRMFDGAMYFGSFIGPIIVLPQIIQVWVYHNTQGVSLASWALFGVSSILWMTYGIIHKEKVLIFANALFTIVNFLVVIGCVVNR